MPYIINRVKYPVKLKWYAVHNKLIIGASASFRNSNVWDYLCCGLKLSGMMHIIMSYFKWISISDVIIKIIREESSIQGSQWAHYKSRKTKWHHDLFSNVTGEMKKSWLCRFLLRVHFASVKHDVGVRFFHGYILKCSLDFSRRAFKYPLFVKGSIFLLIGTRHWACKGNHFLSLGEKKTCSGLFCQTVA